MKIKSIVETNNIFAFLPPDEWKVWKFGFGYNRYTQELVVRPGLLEVMYYDLYNKLHIDFVPFYYIFKDDLEERLDKFYRKNMKPQKCQYFIDKLCFDDIKMYGILMSNKLVRIFAAYFIGKKNFWWYYKKNKIVLCDLIDNEK